MKVPSMEYYKTLMKEKRAGRVKDIIKKYNVRLVKGICSKVSFCISVGNSLLSANIISERMYHEIARSANKTDPELDMIFASRIMSTVRKVLYKDPECFPVVMNVFRKLHPLDSLVAKMEREYYGTEYYLMSISIVLGSLIAVIAIFLAYLMLSTSTVCQEVSHSKLLLTLHNAPISTNISEQSICLDLNVEGKHLLSYYRAICKKGNMTDRSKLPGNWTDFKSLDDLCAVINDVYSKFNIAIVENITAIEDVLITTPTWCLKDIIPILDCLGLDQNYTAILT